MFVGKLSTKNYSWFTVNLLCLGLILLLPPDSWIRLEILVSLCIIAVLPGWFLLEKTKFFNAPSSFWEKLILAIGISISITVSTMYALSYFKIPYLSTLYQVATGIFILFICYQLFNKRKQLAGIVSSSALTTSGLLAGTIFNFLLLITLVPTKVLEVAPLHDPMALSLMAQQVLHGNFWQSSLPSFSAQYPPYLVLFLALISLISGVSTAKLVLIITIVFSCLATLAFGVFISRVYQRSYALPIAMFGTGLFVFYPLKLVISAGKNAQVVGIFFLFYVLTLLMVVFPRLTMWGRFLLVLSLTTAVLVHYTNVILAPLSALYLLLNYRGIGVDSEQSWQAKIGKDLGLWLTCIPILLLLAVQYQVISADHLYLAPTATTLIENETLLDTLLLQISTFWELLLQFKKLFFHSASLFVYYCIFSLAGLLFLFWRTFREKDNKLYLLSALPILLLLMGHSGLSVVSYYARWLYFMFFAVGATTLFILIYEKINRKKSQLFYISFLVILGLVNGNILYKSYTQANMYSLVKATDLDSFDWIKKNIEPDILLLPVRIILRGKAQSFPVDAYHYLEYFTGREPAIKFFGGSRFPYNETYLKDQFALLAKSPRDVKLLRLFYELKIRYFYLGSYTPQGWENFDQKAVTLDVDAHPSIYTKVYDQDGARIYKINFQYLQ